MLITVTIHKKSEFFELNQETAFIENIYFQE